MISLFRYQARLVQKASCQAFVIMLCSAFSEEAENIFMDEKRLLLQHILKES